MDMDYDIAGLDSDAATPIGQIAGIEDAWGQNLPFTKVSFMIHNSLGVRCDGGARR